ncbi:MAG: 16S rRNA (cytidine(1402)-2'-O)-methyltransferase, partial [Streptococcus hyovaginalis]|nr:16S rRNA (cytidine(1402)-2'-O)-methyltransferase [Streptococcus hyovaginalis]
VQKLIDDGRKPNQAIKIISKEYGLNRQELYQQFHNIK